MAGVAGMSPDLLVEARLGFLDFGTFLPAGSSPATIPNRLFRAWNAFGGKGTSPARTMPSASGQSKKPLS